MHDTISNFSDLDPDELAFLVKAQAQYREEKERKRRQAEYEAYARQKYANVQHVTLRITPSLPCSWCERITDVVQAEWSYSGGWQLSVNCYEHGLCEETAEAEAASVARFIVGSHDGKGQASVVVKCRPLAVPGFALEEDEQEDDFAAWEARYYPSELEHRTVYVIWHYDGIQFYLYEAAGLDQTSV